MAYITIDEKQAKIKDYIHKHSKGTFNVYSMLESEFNNYCKEGEANFWDELIMQVASSSEECTIFYGKQSASPFTSVNSERSIMIFVCYNNNAMFDTTSVDEFITNTLGDALEKKMGLIRPYYFEELIKEVAIHSDYLWLLSNEIEPVVIVSRNGLGKLTFRKHPDKTGLFKYSSGKISEQELVACGLGYLLNPSEE